MGLSPGTKLGNFEIVSSIGAGGMGEVYKARDIRLDRSVAIKVLASHIAHDSELRKRFDREARTISSLTHPNICALYDIGHQEGIDFLVMEFIEGESLSERLKKSALPFEEVLKYGIQVSDALSRAHRKGIIHRDLKPGNIMLTKSGAKLLDFGLAKQQPLMSQETITHLSTTSADSLTTQGAILGTLGYMSPEQLDGKEIDARSDIFSFGAVLYEMATGNRAFKASSQASLIAAILTADYIPISKIDPGLPDSFNRLIKTCLAKDPDDRFQTAHDLTLQLQWISDEASKVTANIHAPLEKAKRVALIKKQKRAFGWIAAAVGSIFLAMFLALLIFRVSEDRPMQETVRFAIEAPEGLDTGIAISPDGRHLAFVGFHKGKKLLWLRSLNAMEARVLPDSENARNPFWSPDSRFIGFFSDGKLRKLELSTGSVNTISVAEDPRGASWNSAGVVLFSPHSLSPILRISDQGGEPEQVTILSEDESSHRFPEFLPDGEHFLYLSKRTGTDFSLCIASLKSAERKQLMTVSSKAVYGPNGSILFVREGKLLSQRFDEKRRKLAGDAVVVASDIDSGTTGSADFSVSNNRIVAYRSGVSSGTQLVWYDRNGDQLSTVGPVGKYDEVSLSPDGLRIAVNRENPEQGTRGIWVVDLARGNFSRLTFHPGDGTPAWYPDGTRIAFASSREGSNNIYTKLASGAGSDEPLLKSKENMWPSDFSKDGRYLVMETDDPRTKLDLWLLPTAGNGQPVPLLQNPFNETQAQISPDGKYIAYTSDETGRPEIFVQTFPPSGGKWQISLKGGSQPSWRSDGKELFYIDTEKYLVAVPLKPAPVFEAGVPQSLFRTAVSRNDLGWNKQYAADAAGEKFLVNTLAEEVSPSRIHVIYNWRGLERETR